MSSFYHRLDQKIMESNLSYRDLSERIGKGATYISTMMRNKNDPGLSTVIEICKALDIRLETLLEDDENPVDGPRIHSHEIENIVKAVVSEVSGRANPGMDAPHSMMSIEDMMSWWHQHNGRLENMDAFLENIDLFHPPSVTSNTPDPARVGKSSLVNAKFKIEDESNLSKTLMKMEDRFCSNIAQAHVTALKGQPVLTIEELDVFNPHKNERVTAKYNRLLLPVNDFARNSFILNYSKLVM